MLLKCKKIFLQQRRVRKKWSLIVGKNGGSMFVPTVSQAAPLPLGRFVHPLYTNHPYTGQNTLNILTLDITHSPSMYWTQYTNQIHAQLHKTQSKNFPDALRNTLIIHIPKKLFIKPTAQYALQGMITLLHKSRQ